MIKRSTCQTSQMSNVDIRAYTVTKSAFVLLFASDNRVGHNIKYNLV